MAVAQPPQCPFCALSDRARLRILRRLSIRDRMRARASCRCLRNVENLTFWQLPELNVVEPAHGQDINRIVDNEDNNQTLTIFLTKMMPAVPPHRAYPPADTQAYIDGLARLRVNYRVSTLYYKIRTAVFRDVITGIERMPAPNLIVDIPEDVVTARLDCDNLMRLKSGRVKVYFCNSITYLPRDNFLKVVVRLCRRVGNPDRNPKEVYFKAVPTAIVALLLNWLGIVYRGNNRFKKWKTTSADFEAHYTNRSFIIRTGTTFILYSRNPPGTTSELCIQSCADSVLPGRNLCRGGYYCQVPGCGAPPNPTTHIVRVHRDEDNHSIRIAYERR